MRCKAGEWVSANASSRKAREMMPDRWGRARKTDWECGVKGLGPPEMEGLQHT